MILSIDVVQSILSDICTEIDNPQSKFPKDLCQVLAEIEGITDIGKIRWHEVVYRMQGKWCSYDGSDTFEDGDTSKIVLLNNYLIKRDIRMNVIKGDLIKLAKSGKFDVIVHGCNCFLKFGGGIALSVRREFPEAYLTDKNTAYADSIKLGDYSEYHFDKYNLTVINAYTQYDYRGERGHINVSYSAIKRVFNKIKENYNDKSIGIPMIGAGLAGGDWNRIYSIIDDINFNDLTVVEYCK